MTRPTALPTPAEMRARRVKRTKQPVKQPAKRKAAKPEWHPPMIDFDQDPPVVLVPIGGHLVPVPRQTNLFGKETNE